MPADPGKKHAKQTLGTGINKSTTQKENDTVTKSKKFSEASTWAFEVDYNDHFETGLDAIQHIDLALSLLAKRMGRKKSELCIYDPVRPQIIHVTSVSKSLIQLNARCFHICIEFQTYLF